MSAPRDNADLAVLGGGPGGYVTALCAAQRGARVVLIEKERVGGTCLNVGCIPTTVLTSATELLLRAKQSARFGLSISQVAVDLPTLMAYKRSAVEQLVGGVEQLLMARRVTLMRREAQLIKPDALSIDDGSGGRRELSAQRIILAPGSLPAPPPVAGCNLPGVMASTGALEIQTVPSRLVVVGGGVIGLEFAGIYEALGSQVSVLEMTPTILPGATDVTIAKRRLGKLSGRSCSNRRRIPRPCGSRRLRS